MFYTCTIANVCSRNNNGGKIAQLENVHGHDQKKTQKRKFWVFACAIFGKTFGDQIFQMQKKHAQINRSGFTHVQTQFYKNVAAILNLF